MEILLSREFCESVKPLAGQSLYEKKAIYIKKGKKQLSGLELWSTMVLVVVKICQSLSRGMRRRRSGKEKRNIKGSPGINTI